LTMLYRSTDCLRRGGAPVKNLAHNASLDAGEDNAPSRPGIKHPVIILIDVVAQDRPLVPRR
jgi:hypothetical protein